MGPPRFKKQLISWRIIWGKIINNNGIIWFSKIVFFFLKFFSDFDLEIEGLGDYKLWKERRGGGDGWGGDKKEEEDRSTDRILPFKLFLISAVVIINF